MFDEVARASRYGLGSRSSDRATERISGVNAMHTTSLIKNADSTAALSETATSSARGLLARRVMRCPTSANAPEISSAADSTIMPKSNASVPPSTAA